MKTVAVIPARAGSKRIPGKNIRILNGKPLIKYTIEAALNCDRIDLIMVSSDIAELETILSLGECPKLDFVERPPDLGKDNTTTEDVLINLLKTKLWLQDVSAIVTLLPTSPFRGPHIIDNCLELFEQKNADSVCTFSRERLKLGKFETSSSQFVLLDRDTPAEMYKIPFTEFDNPAVYVTRPSVILENRFIIGKRNYGVAIDKISGLDINDEVDWIFAKALLDSRLWPLKVEK